MNNGAEERRNVSSGWQILKRAVENGRLPDYQVLCMNCQFIKRHESKDIIAND